MPIEPYAVELALSRATTPVMDLTVGVLAIQGGFAEHMQALERQSGVTAIEVRTPEELAAADAMILPGGESTAIGHGLEDAKMLDDIKPNITLLGELKW